MYFKVAPRQTISAAVLPKVRTPLVLHIRRLWAHGPKRYSAVLPFEILYIPHYTRWDQSPAVCWYFNKMSDQASTLGSENEEPGQVPSQQETQYDDKKFVNY